MLRFRALRNTVLAIGVLSGAGRGATEALESGFDSPPLTARPLGWWHWINGNVTKEGIAADLIAAREAGMGGVQTFDVEIYLPKGPVRYGSDLWLEHVRHAMVTAAELGLEFHIMNTPGWSASGGPWVTPERSMKRLVWSETAVEGGEIDRELPLPDLKPYYGGRGVPKERFYRDIAVLAVPAGDVRIDDWVRKTGWASKPLSRSVDASVPAIPPDQVVLVAAGPDLDAPVRTRLPAGSWTLLRFGYTTTGKTNHPAVPEGHGLEIDKLDADAVTYQFEQAVGPLLRVAGPLAGRTFNGLLFDSFEGGFQNWTSRLPEHFRQQKRYDLLPWLPVLTGRVVGSLAESEAVLWDFRHVIEELLAEAYFGTMRRLASQHGLRVFSESQGGPLNPMSANRHVDVPMNEFWTPDAAGRATRIKMTTSAAGFLGRSVVAAEAFTSTPENGRYQNTPASLKRSGDFAFTLGLNRFALHSFTHQPVTEAAPGFSLGRYGVHFGRLNTWWPLAGDWIRYLGRSQFLLQQGRTVAEICVLVDEDLGYGLPSRVAGQWPGFDYEVAYPPMLREMVVDGNDVVHPSGGRFRILVTPSPLTANSWVAERSTLRALRDLVRAGAVVVGDGPAAPAGLADQRAEAEFRSLVDELWGGLDAGGRNEKRVGKGWVHLRGDVGALLRARDVRPDLAWDGPPEAVRFIHRRLSGSDVYFIFNYSEDARRIRLEFRESGREPEIWDAITGRRSAAPVFDVSSGSTTVPVDLEPWGSLFVVFRRPLPARWVARAEGVNFELKAGPMLATGSSVELTDNQGRKVSRSVDPAPSPQVLHGPWHVAFIDGRGAPPELEFPSLQSWTEHAHPDVRHYSGVARYRQRLLMTRPTGFATAVLDLGVVADIARVWINGEIAGASWRPPHRLDVSPWLRDGANLIEIEVANRWINRLIGDEGLPTELPYQKPGVSKFTDGRLLQLPEWLYEPSRRGERTRRSFSTWKHYEVDAPLVPSGLLGPVRIEWHRPVAAP